MAIRVNTSELEYFARKLSNFDAEPYLKQAIEEVAMRLLRKTKLKTPVKSGDLRRGWFVTDVEKAGHHYRVTLYNQESYAMYVEYGHRTKDHQGWVDGKFMLTLSVKEVERQMDKIIANKMQEMWEGLFK